VSGRALGLYLGENHPIIIDRSARNTPIPGGGKGRGAKGTRQADRTLSSEKAPDASRVYPLLVPLRCLDRVQDEDGARGWGRGGERRKETSDRVWSIIRIDSALGTSPGFQRGFTTNAILRCDRAETSTAITTPTGGGSISRRKIEHPDNEREKEREITILPCQAWRCAKRPPTTMRAAAAASRYVLSIAFHRSRAIRRIFSSRAEN